MSDDPMKDILERIAGRNIPEETDLMPRIAATLERKTLIQTLRARPLIATLLALLLLVILSGVAYAISRSLGFSRGLGILETSALRMLAEPVSLERDGVRVTVTEAGMDSTHSVVRYQVEWLSPPAADGEYDGTCQGTPSLTLPDGSPVGHGVAAPDGKGVTEDGYWMRLEFPAVTNGQQDVNLEIPCLIPLVPGPLPRDWQLPLHLVPWDGTPFAPVYQVPSPTAIPTLAVAAETPALPEYGIRLALEQVIELPDGYVFEGSTTWTDANIQDYGVSVSPGSGQLIDGNGRSIPLEWARPQTAPTGPMQNRWAFQSMEKPSALPLTLIVNGYTVRLDTQATFLFDAGSAPQPGQSWPLNLDVPAAGHVLHIDSVAWESDTSFSRLAFQISSDPSVVQAGLFDLQHTAGPGGGGGEPQAGPFTGFIYYENGVPSGPIQVSVLYLEIAVTTPWQATWQP